MSLNAIKYKGELLAEDAALLAKPVGTLGEYKELRADALEADTLDLTVVSESGTIRSFRKNDKVEYFRDGRRVGVYYLQSVTRAGPKLYTLSALSAVGLLIARLHRGGIYTGETVAEVVAEICGGVPVLVESIYRGIKLYGWLPIASARDNLVQVLFAIGAWLNTDENGTLRVQKLWNGTASTIGAGRVHAANIQVKYLDPVSAVAVTEHQYVKGTEDVTLFEGTAQQGDLIEFDAPAHTLAAEGFTILESGVNYAVLSAGTGKLTGRSYIHNMRVVTRTVTEGAAENVEQITDATLVSLVNSSAVAQRMAAYYACREQLTVDVAPAAERAGHVVSLWSEWDKQLTLACIASRETRISGLLKSRTTALVGFVPPQPETSEYFDERVVLTGSGEWTVPEGITEIRAVLIGGGQGGESGSPGSQSTECKAINQTSEVTESTTTYRGWCPMIGGAGGNKGSGGEGGKVLTVSQAVTAGEKIAYAAGVGGAGGAYSADAQTAGSGGADTVFGSHSSADGSTTENGYYDSVSGDIYAAHGADGINGGAGGGGNGETNSTVYVDGESVTDADGNTWTPGANPTSADTLRDSASAHDDYSPSHWTCSVEAVQGMGAGGGAAVGANGSPGTHNASAPNAWSNSNTGNPNGAAYAIAYGGVGGNGGNAVAPAKASKYGAGGAGGNGGGGAGGGGFAYGEKRVSKKYPPTGCDAGGNRGTSGTPGLGSAGGAGADGCIIIYYRRPKPIQPGWVKDKNGKPLLERLNKRLIV